ncbi:MAG: CPBP family intramembrane metalloprotease [Candidatus Obscuribacterales bacterium]|nr:CPBP family intramembrane metalloprotease [Candidatus Obscuribacterales bacterium]
MPFLEILDKIQICAPAALLVLALFSLVLQGKPRYIVKRVLLGVATLVVLAFYGRLIVEPGKMEKMQLGVAAARAEVPLKLQSMLSVGIGKTWEQVFPGKNGDKRPIEIMTSGMAPVVKTAASALDDYLKESPDKPLTKAKLATVLSASSKKKDGEKSRKLVEELKSSQDERESKIGSALHASLSGSDKEHVKAHAKTLEDTFKAGWYREYLMLSLFRNSDSKAYGELADTLEARYFAAFCRSSLLFIIGVVGFLVGLIWLIIQIGSVSRTDARQIGEEEKPQIDLKFYDVFVVLVAWQATQISTGQLMKLIPAGGMKDLAQNPLNLALFLMVSYLLNMGPAIFYIWFLVLKPNGLDFWKSLKIRFKTATSGPVRLILYGPLFWSACIPLVVLTSVIAGQMGSKGSDNPVLAQIVSAAKGPDTIVVLLLFLTIAVMAPICEEIIFRGFLFGVLRKNAGTFIALMGSALVFAGIHLDKGGMLMLFAIGFVLALCYERTRSLVPCMIAHGLWNGGTLVMSLVIFS